MKSEYLQSVKQQFQYYQLLGEKTFNQLSEEQLFWRFNEESNSIATIVKHLSGNMLSRWTDIFNSDGEKPWRDRDREFADEVFTKEQLLSHWNTGWDCLFQAIAQLTDADLERVIYIRNQGHTVLEALNRQLAHYPYHIGQIVFIGKMLRDDQWKSLSIPKGNSEQFNALKFEQPKERKHFTEEYLKSSDKEHK